MTPVTATRCSLWPSRRPISGTPAALAFCSTKMRPVFITAEQDATRITISAQAEREAAENRASAIMTIAQAEAEGQATTYQVDADGQRKLNEARNVMSDKVIDFEVARERLRIIPLAVAETVKPLQNIGDVKIIDMGGGMPGGLINGDGKGGRMDTLVDSLLAYRANAPVIDQLLNEAGFAKHQNPLATLLGSATGGAAAASPPAQQD
jgi:flotillin